MSGSKDKYASRSGTTTILAKKEREIDVYWSLLPSAKCDHRSRKTYNKIPRSKFVEESVVCARPQLP